jgi:hypothetical protein
VVVVVVVDGASGYTGGGGYTAWSTRGWYEAFGAEWYISTDLDFFCPGSI